MIIRHLIDPPLIGTRTEPIRKNRVAWPNFTDVQTPIRVKHEGVCLISVVERSIAGSMSVILLVRERRIILVARIVRVGHIYCRVDDGDIMSPTCMKIRKKSLPFTVAKGICIVVKVSVLVHVINVSPRQPLALPVIVLDQPTNHMFSRGIPNRS